jgi:hypothetical protein
MGAALRYAVKGTHSITDTLLLTGCTYIGPADQTKVQQQPSDHTFFCGHTYVPNNVVKNEPATSDDVTR